MAPSSDEDTDAYSLARDRSKRQKRGTKASARAELLSKIKNAKQTGEKYVPEVEEDDVYELVDEEEYSDIIRKRQDNWIVEDSAGYRDDGREVFDDEYSDEEYEVQTKKSKGSKKKNPNIRKPGSAPTITSMFAATAARNKPKPKEDSKQHDDLLNELLAKADGGEFKSELPSQNSASHSIRPSFKRKQPLPLFSKRPAVRPSPRHERKELPDIDMTELVPSSQPDESDPPPTINTTEYLPDSGNYTDSSYPTDSVSNSQSTITATQPLDIDSMFDDDMNDDEFMEVADKAPPKKVVKAPVLDASTSWTVCEHLNSSEQPAEPVNATVTSVSANTGLPTVSGADGMEVFQFYWLDAYEDYFKHPGTVYLFGKTKSETGSYVSCCVAVKNIHRQIYVLPREHKYDMDAKTLTDDPVTFLNVYNEFNNDVAKRYKIKSFKSKATKKQYSFNFSDVPSEAEYLEVRYGCEYPALSKDLYGETFSRVFGTNTSSLEMFLLTQKIKGPCWLSIANPVSSSHPMSWCKLDVVVSDFSTVSVCSDGNLTPPPLVTLSMCVKSAHNSKTNQNEVVQVACLVNSEYYVNKPPPSDRLFHDHFLAVSKTSDVVFPLDIHEKLKTKDYGHLKMETFGSERALLSFLLAKVHKYDPDILIGHDISNFELDFLLNRIASNKVPHWHKMSRLRRSGDVPRRGMGKSSQIDRSAYCGRVVCDTMISARELIRAKSYDLSELVSQVLRQKREEVEMEQLKQAYNDSSELLRISNLTIQDAFYAHRLLFELNILPLAWQITSICGNVLSRTLLGGRSERNEYLLLHAFTERDFIPPDKSYGGYNKDSKANKGKAMAAPSNDMDPEDADAAAQTSSTGRRKPAYAGGLVLEPKKGFYDTFILLLDFNSLYPSIIQEYNICFTTVSQTSGDDSQSEDIVIPDIPDSGLPAGVLPIEIRKLVQSRKQVKGLMKEKGISKEQCAQYDIRQKALKLTANSMYGCLGFTYSRFYAKPLAALITAKGREILQKTKDLVEKQGLDVIYGDTDSIMINTNSRNIDEVFKLGSRVKSEVNKAYRLLEIDIDGVFKSMLLLKKKKYAALNVVKGSDGQYTTTQELKGLDIVRRDWCELSKQTGQYVVSEILSGQSRELIVQNIHTKLQEVKQAVHADEIPLDLYCITKQLTKAPETYPDKKSLPHVTVALRLNSGSAKQLRAGDTVYYVICQDGSNLPASQRAYHLDEMSKNDKLSVDTEYYLAHQIHPVVSRLCDPIEGTDSALIAEMLGLDSSRYQHKTTGDDDEEEAHSRLVSEEEKYKNCDRLDIVCHHPSCGRKNVIDSPYRLGQGKEYVYSWQSCVATEPDGSPSHPLQLYPPTQENNSAVNTIKNKLHVSIRSHVNSYYQGWLKCEDAACGHRTRRVSLQLYRGRPVCPLCTKSALIQEYTESMLYDQLCFYKYIFSLQHLPSSVKVSTPMNHLYKEVTLFMEEQLSRSEYGQINLEKLFSRIVLPSSVLSSNHPPPTR